MEGKTSIYVSVFLHDVILKQHAEGVSTFKQ